MDTYTIAYWEIAMTYTNPGAQDAIDYLGDRTDTVALRMKKLMQMPDLTGRPNSPVFYIVEAIRGIESLGNHDLVEIPEIVSVKENFDLLGTPEDHPSRAPSDTFYIDDGYILRTQTTTMWSYYLRDPLVLERLCREGTVLAISYGKVYRNDEIDRYHYPAWHNIDGLCISKTLNKQYTVTDLIDVLVDIAKSIYGPEIEWRVDDDRFPFTDPSIELQILWDGDFVEVLGAGLVHRKVLTLLGLDPDRYNGWAFGFGLDRLAMIKMNIPDIRILWSEDTRITSQFRSIDSVFQDVSKYPATDRDISIIISKTVDLNSIYGLMRDCGNVNGEDIIEEVKLIDTYADDSKFGDANISRTFRISYRSFTRTLEHAEVNENQERLRIRVKEEFGATLR